MCLPKERFTFNTWCKKATARFITRGHVGYAGEDQYGEGITGPMKPTGEWVEVPAPTLSWDIQGDKTNEYDNDNWNDASPRIGS